MSANDSGMEEAVQLASSLLKLSNQMTSGWYQNICIILRYHTNIVSAGSHIVDIKPVYYCWNPLFGAPETAPREERRHDTFDVCAPHVVLF